MSTSAANGGSSVMVRILVAQIGIGAVLAVVFWGMAGHVAGYSALIGALACAIPNAFLALRLAVPRRDPGARALLSAAYIGELGKLAITVLIFSIAFAWVRPLAVGALFAGFIAAQLMTFLGLMMRDGQAETDQRLSNGE